MELVLLLLAIYLLSVAKAYFMFYVSDYDVSHPICLIPVVNTCVSVLFICALIYGLWLKLFDKDYNA